MKLGDVLKKEREKKGISLENMAATLHLSEEAYSQIEQGESPAEAWGPILAKLAIKLETPCSRLLADSGQSADIVEGQCGDLVRKHRSNRGVEKESLAAYAEISIEEYDGIEKGTSPLETYGRILLGFAEAIDQPVFNLFYPCGLPFQELDDYP